MKSSRPAWAVVSLSEKKKKENKKFTCQNGNFKC